MTAMPTVPIGAHFYNLRFAVSPEAAAQNSYPVGANGIHALWDYGHESWRFCAAPWKHNGEEWLYKEEVWEAKTQRGVNGTVTDVVLLAR
ncbi:MAG: hypothetical protein M5U34_12720 [Chloroflexi bacterium]|nr:hypothetical protein [Chloroflexota bacterium]